jgi:hypothetical protein
VRWIPASAIRRIPPPLCVTSERVATAAGDDRRSSLYEKERA